MSPVFLSKIENILKTTNLKNDIEFAGYSINYFKNMKKGYWVYPGALVKHTSSGQIIDIYYFLSLLHKEGMLKPYLEAYCPNCYKLSSIAHETIDEFALFQECDCGEEFSPQKHLVVIYKVVVDD